MRMLGTTHNETEIFTVNEIVFISFDPATLNHRNKICMNVVLGGFSLQVRKDF